MKKFGNNVNATEKVNMGYRKVYIPLQSRKGYTPPKLKGNGNE